jgi:uncharacterized protein (TIGR02118 family)
LAKVLFILQRRGDRTLDEVREQWSGEKHMSHVRRIPGLTKFVQNYIVASPAGHVCDGIGELWFENDEVMEKALNSPEMGAAVESAQNFLDMEKTSMVIVEENAIIR